LQATQIRIACKIGGESTMLELNLGDLRHATPGAHRTTLGALKATVVQRGLQSCDGVHGGNVTIADGPVTITIEEANGGVGEHTLVTPDFRRLLRVNFATGLFDDGCGIASLGGDIRLEQTAAHYTSELIVYE
jgi:hypothetical protein